jgi:hypothetical protein
MLNEQTIEKLTELRLRSMAKAFRDQIGDPAMNGLSFEDRFGLIVDRQWSDRKNSHITRLIKAATFKFLERVWRILNTPDRRLNRDHILQIATGKYIKVKSTSSLGCIRCR